MNPQQPDSSENFKVINGSKLHMKRLKTVKENQDDGMFRHFSVSITPAVAQKPPDND